MTQCWSPETLCAWGKEAGFAEVAFCLPDAFDNARISLRNQPIVRERNQLRFDPVDDDPRTRSIAVLLWPYHPARIDATADDDRVFIDSYYYASNKAYHMAGELEKRARNYGGFARANVPYPAREAAVRAGLGIVGKNGLLITPRFGTRVVIVLMSTDLLVKDLFKKGQAIASVADSCADCGNCVQACPVGAITTTGMCHPERCLRNYMMEGIVTPPALREMMGMRLLGCDICQRVCPMQQKLQFDERKSPHLSDFVTVDPAIFSASVSRLALCIGRNIARPQRIRAQAALLAGNLRNPRYLPVLNTWSNSSFGAVRMHARWAIEQIGRCPANKTD